MKPEFAEIISRLRGILVRHTGRIHEMTNHLTELLSPSRSG